METEEAEHLDLAHHTDWAHASPRHRLDAVAELRTSAGPQRKWGPSWTTAFKVRVLHTPPPSTPPRATVRAIMLQGFEDG